MSAFKIFIFASPLSSEETVMSSMAHPRATSCAVGAMSRPGGRILPDEPAGSDRVGECEPRSAGTLAARTSVGAR